MPRCPNECSSREIGSRSAGPSSSSGGAETVAATVSPFVLTVLKYVFLALVYFFVFRAIRAVAIDIAGRRQARSGTPRAEMSRTRGQGKAPQVVVVKDEGGKKLAAHRLNTALQIGRADACH